MTDRTYECQNKVHVQYLYWQCELEDTVLASAEARLHFKRVRETRHSL